MTPRCARSRRRCRPPRRPATISQLSLAEYALGVALLSRDAAADRHRGLELMVQARDFAARACSSSWSRSPSCGPPGRGPGAATAMLPLR